MRDRAATRALVLGLLALPFGVFAPFAIWSGARSVRRIRASRGATGPQGAPARRHPCLAVRVRAGLGSALPARHGRLRERAMPGDLSFQPLPAAVHGRPLSDGRAGLQLGPSPDLVEPARA